MKFDSAYMSYCRFEGTLHELQACLVDAQEHFDGKAERPVSDREINKFRIMISEFYDFLTDNCLINSYGDFRWKRFDKLCETLRECGESNNGK